MKTAPNNHVIEDLDKVLYKEAKQLTTRVDSILLGNKTYSELFDKIVKYISENIFKRITDKRLTIEKAAKKDQSILFQLIGSLNLMHPQEIVKFKMLANFLESENSCDCLEKILYVAKSEIDGLLVISIHRRPSYRTATSS